MSSKASVEIWHTILKYAISVPIFLDSDPVESHGIDILKQYSYERPYWQSERTRNSLRCVCRGWNTYMEPYNHRFVRLDDVFHDRVPFTALASAIRVDLDWNDDCRCIEHCWAMPNGNYWQSMTDVWCAVPFSDQGPALWKVEIVKGWLMERSVYAVALKQRAPNLRVMLLQSSHTFLSSEETFPNLKLLTMDMDDPRPFFSIKGMALLTALHATVDSLGPPMDKADFPSLSNLSIQMSCESESPLPQDLYNFLQHIGPQLHTFYYRHPLLQFQIEPILWETLPRIKQLQIPYTWHGSEIPTHHPLQRIQLSPSILRTGFDYDLNWPDLVRLHLPRHSAKKLNVRMETTWHEELATNSAFILWMNDHCTTCNLLLTDAHGDSFVQYVVFLISAFWNQPARQYSQIPQSSRNGVNGFGF